MKKNLSNFAPQYTPIDPGRKISCDEAQANSRYIRVRYENHSCNSLSYEFNTHKGDTSFILRETEDRSQIQMLCTSDGGTRYCPNYGKLLQTCHFWTTLYSQKICTHQPSQQYVIVRHPIQNKFSLCCYKNKEKSCNICGDEKLYYVKSPHTFFIF